LNLTFPADSLFFLWGICSVLFLIRHRFACFANAVGLMSLGSLIMNRFFADFSPSSVIIRELILSVQSFPAETWLWFVVVLHLGEWFLIRLDGARDAQPAHLKNISGERVYGYRLGRIWPICLFVSFHGSWILFPVMSGFSALNVSRSNLQQKRFASTLCLLYLLVLSAFLITARWFDLFLWVAAVFSLIGHELIYFMIRRRERNREPMFVSDENGLKVYAVVPKSPAVEMGIQPGDLILRVNQVPVKTMADLEEAIKKQSVCKMEILTSQLERKLVQKVIYEEELKSLGVIGAVKKSEPVTESKVESEAVALQ
jgi:hypothetical protein